MKQGPRLFIKDMVYYLMPQDGKPADTVPSLQKVKRGIGTDGTNGTHSANGVTADVGSSQAHPTNGVAVNPTVVPVDLLKQFHFAFLIRDPHYSIPSYYRCTIPPLNKLTGFYDFCENEAGYEEVHRFFDYLREAHMIGPHVANGKVETNGVHDTNGTNGSNGASQEGTEICVVDADDLLDNPSGIIERFCKSVGEEYTPDMLNWDNEEDQLTALRAFEKWPGFHEDAIDSKCLKARTQKKKAKTEAEFDAEWREKYGEKGAKIIRSAVDRSMPDYLYLKQYAMRV